MDIKRSNSLTDLAGRVQREHKAVATALKRSVEHAMAAGDLLLEAKSQLVHGQWRDWLRDSCGLSERTAQRYMRLAGNRTEIESNTPCVSDLSINSALAMLANPRDLDSLAAAALAQAGGVLSDAEQILGIRHCSCECRRRQPFFKEAQAAKEKMDGRPDPGGIIARAATLAEGVGHAYCIHVLCERYEEAYQAAEDLEGRAQGMKSSRDGAGLHIGQIYAMLTRNDDCKCRAALRLIGEI